MRALQAGAIAVGLAPLAFLVASSVALLSARGWWNHPYYADAWWWLAWADYAREFPNGGWHAWGWNMRMGMACGLAAGLLAVYAVLTMARRFHTSSVRRSLHGNAKWQTMRGARRSGITFHARPPGDGILLGKRYFGPVISLPPIKRIRFRGAILGFGLYAALRGEGHVSLTAMTGAGKGVGVVNPNAFNWDGPLVCFSVKDDVYKATAAQRARKGDRVYLLDLTNPSYRSHRYSGLGELSDVYDDIQRAMFTLIPEVKASNPFWNDAARMVATAAGVILAHTPGETPTIGKILAMVAREDYAQHIAGLIQDARLQGRGYPKAATRALLSWVQNGEHAGGPARESVQQTIITSLSLWNTPRIEAVTNGDDFQLGKLRSERVSLYIVAQPGDIQRLRPVYNLFFTQLFYKNQRDEWAPNILHRPVRTLAIFDERWALGAMRVVDDAMAFVRSYGIRMLNVMQTKSQMRNALGADGADNMFSNHYVEMLYGGCDQATAKEVSERMGYRTEEVASTSRPSFFGMNLGKHSDSISAQRRPLLLPQEVSELPQTTAIVLIKGQPPLKLRKIESWRDPTFKHMNGVPPVIPKLQVKVEIDGQEKEPEPKRQPAAMATPF